METSVTAGETSGEGSQSYRDRPDKVSTIGRCMYWQNTILPTVT